MVMSAGELNLRVFSRARSAPRVTVVAFLSVLELVRTTEIRLFQRETLEISSLALPANWQCHEVSTTRGRDRVETQPLILPNIYVGVQSHGYTAPNHLMVLRGHTANPLRFHPCCRDPNINVGRMKVEFSHGLGSGWFRLRRGQLTRHDPPAGSE